MDAFKKKVKVRITVCGGLVLIGTALIVINRFLGEHIGIGFDPSETMLDSHAFNLGLICAFIFIVVFRIHKYSAALRNDEKLKKMYIAETDERTLLILQKSGSIGMNVSMVGLTIGASISAYFNVTVFFALLGACLFISVIRGFLKLYYKNKL